MAKRPVNTGSDGAGPDGAHAWEPAGPGAPSPVHHQGVPRSLQAAPRHRPTTAVQSERRHQDGPERRPQDPAEQGAEVRVLAWLPYLIVLAGAVTGLTVAWRGSRHARLGTEGLSCERISFGQGDRLARG